MAIELLAMMVLMMPCLLQSASRHQAPGGDGAHDALLDDDGH